MMRPSQILLSLIFLLIVSPKMALSQLPRERVVTDEPVVDLFPASMIVGTSTAQNLASRNLNSSVTHTFGLVEGGIDHFFGLDDGANTRIGLDYGVTDRFSMGISRMTFLKVVDLRGKYTILKQMASDRSPVEMSIKGSISATTLPGTGMSFIDRLSYFISLPTARKFNRLSLQVSPMVARFNTASPERERQLMALGMAAVYRLSERYSIGMEYLPVLNPRNPDTTNAMAVVLDIETGGHIFQLFLGSSQWHHEAYILANNTDRFLKGDIRFGFTIHRVFGL